VEVSERLVGSPAFKAGGMGDPCPAGSIPVHLRHEWRHKCPVSGRVWLALALVWCHPRASAARRRWHPRRESYLAVAWPGSLNSLRSTGTRSSRDRRAGALLRHL